MMEPGPGWHTVGGAHWQWAPAFPGLGVFLVSLASPWVALGQFAGPHRVTWSPIFPRAAGPY